MKIGSTDITAAYLGSTSLQKVYVGSTEIWSSFTGLLDTYTGAAAAYSLRLLRAGYTGYAIKVRRASDNTEQDIGFSNNELDTTTLASFCSGTNGYVTTWYDQSGNSNNMLQTTAANQPKIYDSSTGLITENGKAAVQFDGSNDFFYKASYNFNTSNFTAISIAKTTSTSLQSVFDIDGLTRIAQLTSLQSNIARVYSFSSDGNTVDTVPITTNTRYLFFAYNNSTTLQIYANSFSNGSVSSITQVTGTDDLRIGSTVFGLAPLQGTGQEFILYQSDQSSNRTGIETNINTQYQIYWDGSQTSLLDTYGGSAAAYSLRALSSSYTGALIKVRRASDNAEQDIYAKYDGNLNTDALQSFCSGTDGFVTTWYDQSGNGRNATQSTAANQPQIVSSGSVILLNGKPSIKYQDNTDILRASSSGTFTTNTMAVVFKFNNLNSYGVVMSIGLTDENCYALLAQPSNQRSIYSGSPTVSSLNGTATQNQEIWGSTTETNSRKFWANGVSQTITDNNVSITANLNHILIGNDFFASTRNPDMQEAIYWNATKSDTDLVGINTNQNNFYNVY